MNHDVAVLQVPDLVRGELDAATRTAVAEHVDSCERCRVLAQVFRQLAMDPGSDGRLHPPPSLLVAYALRAPELGNEVSRRVLRHVEGCPDCTEEVETIRHAEATRADDRKVGRRAKWIAAIAASLLLIALAYTLEQSKPPAVASSRMIAIPPEAAREWPGETPWTVLTGRLRGAEALEPVHVSTDDLYVRLAVGPMPVSLGDEQGVQLKIFDEKGNDAASIDLDAASLNRLLRGSELVYLLVRVSELSTGEHRLVVTAADELLIDATFSVYKQAESSR